MFEEIRVVRSLSHRRQEELALHSPISLDQGVKVVIDSQANRRTSSSTSPALDVAIVTSRSTGRVDSHAATMLATLAHSAGDNDLPGHAAKGRPDETKAVQSP